MGANTVETCEHSWIVYSFSLCPPTIMVYCEKCGEDGFIEDFTEEDWDKAFYAPSDNYPKGMGRVVHANEG